RLVVIANTRFIPKLKTERRLKLCETFVPFVPFAVKNVLFTKSVIVSITTWQPGSVHHPGLPRLTAINDMFSYLLIVSPLDCFVPHNDIGCRR
ncbi:MAG: hypothetical protein LBF85_09185, partial [Tannerella sp.]|nr:hypothetical protein [Tannerella sp.]